MTNHFCLFLFISLSCNKVWQVDSNKMHRRFAYWLEMSYIYIERDRMYSSIYMCTLCHMVLDWLNSTKEANSKWSSISSLGKNRRANLKKKWVYKVAILSKLKLVLTGGLGAPRLSCLWKLRCSAGNCCASLWVFKLSNRTFWALLDLWTWRHSPTICHSNNQKSYSYQTSFLSAHFL
jgi:hypothetical protein